MINKNSTSPGKSPFNEVDKKPVYCQSATLQMPWWFQIGRVRSARVIWNYEQGYPELYDMK